MLLARFVPLEHDSNGETEALIEVKLCTLYPSAHFTCVPWVVTCGPWQWAFEGAVQVEEGPDWQNNMADVHVGQNDQGCYSDSWGTRVFRYLSRICLKSHIRCLMSGFSLATAKDDEIHCLVGEHKMYTTFHKHYRITLSAYGMGGGFNHRAPGIFLSLKVREYL